MSQKNILITSVIVALLAIAAGVSYILFKDDIRTTNNKEKVDPDTVETSSSIETLDINSRLVQSLYNKVVLKDNSYYKYFMYENNDNYIVSQASEMSKLTLAYQNLKEDELSNVSIANLPTTMVITGYTYSSLGLSYHTLCRGDVWGLDDNYVSFFTYDALLLAYRDLFGNNIVIDKSIPIKTDPYGVKYYIYNETLDGYIPYIIEGGRVSGSYFNSKVTKAVKYDNQIIIYEEVTQVPLDSSIKVSEPTTYVYTFNIDNDNMYSFVSRIKE